MTDRIYQIETTCKGNVNFSYVYDMNNPSHQIFAGNPIQPTSTTSSEDIGVPKR